MRDTEARCVWHAESPLLRLKRRGRLGLQRFRGRESAGERPIGHGSSQV